jgi:hypothetical protein
MQKFSHVDDEGELFSFLKATYSEDKRTLLRGSIIVQEIDEVQILEDSIAGRGSIL